MGYKLALKDTSAKLVEVLKVTILDGGAKPPISTLRSSLILGATRGKPHQFNKSIKTFSRSVSRETLVKWGFSVKII